MLRRERVLDGLLLEVGPHHLQVHPAAALHQLQVVGDLPADLQHVPQLLR